MLDGSWASFLFPGAALGLDRDVRSWHLPRRRPTRARPVLLGDGRRRYAERNRARTGAGWCFRELRGGRRLWTCSAHGVHAARSPGNLHDPGSPLPGVLEKVNERRFARAALEYTPRSAVVTHRIHSDTSPIAARERNYQIGQECHGQTRKPLEAPTWPAGALVAQAPRRA